MTNIIKEKDKNGREIFYKIEKGKNGTKKVRVSSEVARREMRKKSRRSSPVHKRKSSKRSSSPKRKSSPRSSSPRSSIDQLERKEK